MNPSTGVSLPDRAVQAVVEHLRASREMWLQHLHSVCLQELVNGIFRILQVSQLPRACRAVLAACRRQPLADAVIAQRTFIARVLCRVEKAATVGTSLNAIATAQTVFVIDQHHSIRSVISGANWADLCARRVYAMVAQLRYEEVLSAGQIALREA